MSVAAVSHGTPSKRLWFLLLWTIFCYANHYISLAGFWFMALTAVASQTSSFPSVSSLVALWSMADDWKGLREGKWQCPYAEGNPICLIEATVAQWTADPWAERRG